MEVVVSLWTPYAAEIQEADAKKIQKFTEKLIKRYILYIIVFPQRSIKTEPNSKRGNA